MRNSLSNDVADFLPDFGEQVHFGSFYVPTLVDPFPFSPHVHVSLHARSLPPSFLHLTFLPSFLLTPCQVTDGTSTDPPPTFRPVMHLPPHALSPPTKVLVSPYLRSFLSFLTSFLHTFLFPSVSALIPPFLATSPSLLMPSCISSFPLSFLATPKPIHSMPKQPIGVANPVLKPKVF